MDSAFVAFDHPGQSGWTTLTGIDAAGGACPFGMG
jgi:hypothetical protein